MKDNQPNRSDWSWWVDHVYITVGVYLYTISGLSALRPAQVVRNRTFLLIKHHDCAGGWTIQCSQILSGVPQGPVLEACLFPFYINDLPKYTFSHYIFAWNDINLLQQLNMKCRRQIYNWYLLPSYIKSDDDIHMLCIMFLLLYYLHRFMEV